MPNALPYIFGGMKISITLAIIGVIVSEFVASQEGIGYLIKLAGGLLDTPLMLGAITTQYRRPRPLHGDCRSRKPRRVLAAALGGGRRRWRLTAKARGFISKAHRAGWAKAPNTVRSTNECLFAAPCPRARTRVAMGVSACARRA